MAVNHKPFKQNVSGKVVSISPNPQQDYENKKAGSLMKGWDVKVSGIDIEENIVYHSKGKDSTPIFKEGETIDFDMVDVVHDTKGHWYYKMSVKSDFAKSKYSNPENNKKRMKTKALALTNLTIQYFIQTDLMTNDDFNEKILEEYATKIYYYITGFNPTEKIHKFETDISLMELRAQCFETVLFNSAIYKATTLKEIGLKSIKLLAEMEAK